MLLEDDQVLAALVLSILRNADYTIDHFIHGTAALAALQRDAYGLALLDVMVPGLSGVDVLRSLRKLSSMPVILLTAKGSLRDRVEGLTDGADDYLVKPFEAEELVARIGSVLRRTQSRDPLPAQVLQASGVTLNRSVRSVEVNGVAVNLTGVEFEILELLLMRAGTVVSREELTRCAQQRPLDPFDRSLDVHIMRLRRKLETREPLIHTIRGVGYQFVSRRDG